MNLQDIYHMTGTAAAIIITLIVFIKAGVNFRRKVFYKIDSHEWEHINDAINNSRYRMESIDERLKEIEKKADIKKKI